MASNKLIFFLKVPLPLLSNMDAASLSSIIPESDSLFVLISAAVLPQLEKLSFTQHHQQAQADSIRLLVDTYRNISKEKYDPKNACDNPGSVLPRTVEDTEIIFCFVINYD